MSTVNSFVKDNVEYYQLYIACPICLREGRPSVPVYWHHSLDGYDMYIGDNGYYYCEKCGYTAPVIEWGYTCADCIGAGHEKAVKLDDLKHLAEALAISGMVTHLAGMKWLTRVTNSLIQQCEGK